MDLASYRTLGHSGLVVSPMALGTMTFGGVPWGASDEDARSILDSFIERGGNFIDTAESYSGGRSEALVGAYIAERSLRDKVVIGTKFAWNQDPGNPNAGGNGRKNILRAVEGSLKRLRTDYIDLYWLHFWDMLTPVVEMLGTMVDLVRAGKIRYFALSDVPAWYAAKMAAIAEARGMPGPLAIQTEYSLVERTAEQEHFPAALDANMAIVPWSPLAGGFLSGKYTRGGDGVSGKGRLAGENPFGNSKFNDRNWAILSALNSVAEEIGRPPAQVALAWALHRPGVAALLLGASRHAQFDGNLAALDLKLSADQQLTLDNASALPSAFPYSGFNDGVKKSIFGGTQVVSWQSLSLPLRNNDQAK